MPSYRVLLLGLDGAGKSTLLRHAKPDQPRASFAPAAAFNVELVRCPRHDCSDTFCVWDVNGDAQTRRLWQHYALGTQLLWWVVNAAEAPARLQESRDELDRLLKEATFDALEEVALVVTRANDDSVEAVADLFQDTRMRAGVARTRIIPTTCMRDCIDALLRHGV